PNGARSGISSSACWARARCRRRPCPLAPTRRAAIAGCAPPARAERPPGQTDGSGLLQSLSAGAAGPAWGLGPAAREIYRYIWRTSRRSQVILALLATVTLLLDLIPLELQRRIVNDALKHHALDTLIELGALYVVVALVQGATKLGLNLYQAAVSERANRHLRLQAGRSVLHARAEQQDVEREGVGISIIVSEVESVGGFVGSAVSDLVLHGGVLVTVFGYLLILQPWMGLIGLFLFGPQLLFVPMLQFAINQRTAARIKILRALSVDIVKEAADAEPERDAAAFARDIRRVYDLN